MRANQARLASDLRTPSITTALSLTGLVALRFFPAVEQIQSVVCCLLREPHLLRRLSSIACSQAATITEQCKCVDLPPGVWQA